jgi:S1-C subfamily serine protease
MTTDLLTSFSNQLADAVAAAAPSVVQVQGRRRPASGLVYADNVVLTTVRALGRDDGLHVRTDEGRTLDAELAGWDPSTGLAVLRVAELKTTPIAPAAQPPRVGHLALAVARSWSNVVTASAGIVSIGGPLPTGAASRSTRCGYRADARLRRRRRRHHRPHRRDHRRRSAASASSSRQHCVEDRATLTGTGA